ncbi:MAG TPA: hypothetical protein VK140_11945 [Ktedonobacteraceae bacterium]|nr:hypothetical protein [Ktedonobacteraceae bacterium]
MNNQPYPPDPRVQGYQQSPNQPPYEGQTYGASNSDGASMQSRRESYVDPVGNQVENRVEVFEDQNQRRANMRYWISRIIYFVLTVLEVILLLRFFFRLLGANQDNAFITFLYNLSHIFVVAFNGIFNDQALGKSVFETSTIVAMVVYALLAWGIVSLCNVLFAPNVPGRQSTTTTRRRRVS